MSLFAKVRTATLAVANEVADKQIAKMPLPMLKQHIRDLEANMREMQTQIGVQGGNVLDAETEVKNLTAQITSKTNALKAFAAGKDPKDPEVQKRASFIVSLQKQVASKTETLNNLKAMQQQMQTAYDVLDGQHTEAMNRLHDLTSMVTDTKALEAGKKAAAIVTGLATDSVDGMNIHAAEQAIQHEHNVATSQFNQAMSTLHVPEPEADPEHQAAVDDLLGSILPQATTTAS